ncbi:MAG: hypothetical protein LKF44_08270 [Atopobiaceae bacterium]|jgi:hypothetical protein|nr:hypothetical protein [Atopobiaceae bacterium]
MAELFATQTTGRDRLGNLTGSSVSIGKVRVRIAPWSTVPTENDGNDFDSTALTLVTTAPLPKLRAAETLACSVGGRKETYSVSGVSDLGRRRAISCSRMKGV